MALKKCRYSIIVLILFTSIITLLGYIFIFKDKHDIDREKKGQAIILAIDDFDDYRDIYVQDDGAPIIAIVIDGVGFLNPQSKLDLPNQITLGMPSYVPFKEYEYNSKIMKHNIVLNIPLEPINYPEEDPDPGALLSNNDEIENFLKLNAVLEKSKNYKAVYSSNDDKYTSSKKETENLLLALKNKKLIYLSGLVDKKALVYELAKQMRYNILGNDVILDSVISRDEISEKLAELEEVATSHGAAIAFGNSYPLTVEMLNEWIPTLVNKGIKIVPIEDFYKVVLKRKALPKN